MSKHKIRVPFFEMGVKNYVYGDAVLDLAMAAEAASAKYEVDVLFISPYTEIRRISEACPRLIVMAPHMDTLRPGRGLADVLPEAVKAAGARGVVINHCERPVTLSAMRKTIERANELDLLSFVCADTIAEAKAIAAFHPDIINPEPSELIGSGNTSGMEFVKARRGRARLPQYRRAPEVRLGRPERDCRTDRWSVGSRRFRPRLLRGF